MALASSATIPMLDATLVHEKPESIVDQDIPTTRNHDGVRIVAPHEYKEAAACLAEAFRFDNIVRYAVDTPDREHMSDEERFELHRTTMEYVTYAHCLNGLVLTAGEHYDCVALWLPPGKNIDDWLTIVRSGMWRLRYKLSKEGKIRFFDEFLPLLHDTKQEVLGERDDQSWYLNYVGTKPEARGKGYARKVIEYVSKLADDRGLPCYLESSHDINIIIYGKLGFELRKQIYLTRACGKELRLDVMVREPATYEKNGDPVVSKSK
ncbi:hypothetical protein PV08_01609 [Exophiala spinifera]|uniref:N-acetyltransferase domain-containing protein n=1 Tax=Exophiala spinifera TaxID=91928 RepID=A0A0D2BRM4_9EURO|nr:uncharacterized protein PV08_01609 [Exophiala spinifera]KIW21030.1 hypothetical protein PV08_01609 [Exophiala spinifera]